MSGNLIFDEGELSMAMNKLERYFTFLDGCFGEYDSIMGSISGEGLEDVKILMQIFNLRQLVKLEKREFGAQLSGIRSSVTKQIAETEAADNFVYPDLSMGDIISLLGSFL